MEGLDAVVFTGGVGTNAPEVRRMAAGGLGFLGVAIDAEANASQGGDRPIGEATAPVHVYVVNAREDLQIAHEVRQVLQAPGALSSRA